jgi:hypothetical protein
MREKISLKNSKVFQVYNLLNSYVSTGKNWLDHVKFQLFIIANKRLLGEVVCDLEDTKKAHVEYLEYEEKMTDLVRLYYSKSDRSSFDDDVEKIEKEYENSDSVKRIKELMDSESSIEVLMIDHTDLPSKGLSLGELELLFDFIK